MFIVEIHSFFALFSFDKLLSDYVTSSFYWVILITTRMVVLVIPFDSRIQTSELCIGLVVIVAGLYLEPCHCLGDRHLIYRDAQQICLPSTFIQILTDHHYRFTEERRIQSVLNIIFELNGHSGGSSKCIK